MISQSPSGFLRSPAPPQPRALMATLLPLVVGAALFTLYTSFLTDAGPSRAALVTLGGCGFIGTLLALEFGIGVTLMAMLLSPEIPVSALGGHLRFEDLLMPFLLLAWLGRKALGLDRKEIAHDFIIWLMALFIALQAFSTARAWTVSIIHPVEASFVILKQLQFFAVFYFIWQYTHTRKRARNLLIVAIATALVVALYNLFLIPSTEVWTRNRISAPFEGTPEPSSIGGYFVLMLALLLALLLEAETPKQRLWLGALTALIFTPFLYTLSRTSYVAFLAVVVVLSALKRSRTLFGLLVVGLALSPLLLPDSVIDRVMYTFNDHIKVFGIFDRSFGERIYIWYKVYWTMLESPWIGLGVTFHNVIDSYYARLLIESGIIGLIAFTALIVRLWLVARRLRQGGREWWVRAFALGYSAALIALLLHAFSAITFVIIRIMEPFWAVTGILFGLVGQLEDGDGADGDGALAPETAGAEGR